MSDGLWTDYDEMLETFATAGLAIPYIPVSLRAAMRSPRRWMWSSRASINASGMYMFGEYTDEVLTASVADYVALSHAGHGTNSYGLNFHLVYGPLALFTQDGWGGIYMDPVKTAAIIARTFELCRGLIEVAESVAEQNQAHGNMRIVVKWSRFRSVSAHALVGHSDGAEFEWVRHRNQDGLFAAARGLVSALYG